MSAVFLKILNLSLSASWLILTVILARFLLKKAPKWISCLLWGLVAFRLLCPFTLESALSVLPSAQVVPDTIAVESEPQIESGIRAVDDSVNPIIQDTFSPDPAASVNPMQIVLAAASMVWLTGAVLLLFYALVSFLLIKKRVRASVPIQDRVLACDEVKSPFILGIIRPVIYVPSDMDEETLDLVVAHEQAHLRRRDHWWKPFGFVLLAVYWFNPLCWAAYILFCRDMEAACDEKVIRGKEREYVAAYAQALLNLSVPRKTVAACPLAFGEAGVKARVKGVLNYKKPAFWIGIAGVILCAVLAVCLLTDPQIAIKQTARITADEMQGRGAEALFGDDVDEPMTFQEIEVPGLKEGLDLQLFAGTGSFPIVADSKATYEVTEFYLANSKSIYCLFNLSFEKNALLGGLNQKSGEKEAAAPEKHVLCTDIDRDGREELCTLCGPTGAYTHYALSVYEKEGTSVRLKYYIPFQDGVSRFLGDDFQFGGFHVYFVKKDGEVRICDEDENQEYRFRFEKHQKFHFYNDKDVDVTIDLREFEKDCETQRAYEEQSVKAMEEYPHARVSGLVKKMPEAAQKRNPGLKFSSDPYDYVSDNTAYDDLVKLGVAAVPELLEILGSSEENGLNEYLIAITVEDIMDCDLKKTDYFWEDAKGFLEQWNRMVEERKKIVESVLESDMTVSEKENRLEPYGKIIAGYIRRVKKGRKKKPGTEEAASGYGAFCEGDRTGSRSHKSSIL